MTGENFETYDFLINDEDEAMLLLYVREGEPENASLELNLQERSAVLHRNTTDEISLSDIPEDVLDSLQDADKILVCELSIEADEKDTRIIHAYEAEITD